MYNHLGQIHGAITPEAATQGIDIYAEHSEDARLNPGKHPNIDRLIGLVERGETLRVKHVLRDLSGEKRLPAGSAFQKTKNPRETGDFCFCVTAATDRAAVATVGANGIRPYRSSAPCQPTGQPAIIPAPTVLLVDSSIRMKAPVARESA